MSDATPTDPVTDLLDFPLLEAMFGRRSRRFGMGMSIESGPLAFTSDHDPAPLTRLEQDLLIASGTGVTGWHFGVPFGPDRPDSYAHYSHRFTGRTAPTAAGFGTPMLLFTDDHGTYLTNNRDQTPSAVRSFAGDAGDLESITAPVRDHTVKLTDRRLDLPAQPPHVLPPNLWMANAPGSTLFMPVADASEQTLGLLTMAMANGNFPVDDRRGRPAGDLAPFVRSGLLDETKPTPISVLQQMAYDSNIAELSFMAHNIVLTMQAMGLGGLFLCGINSWSALGAFAASGVNGFGFRFVEDERWTLPNPVGLDGHFESLCPPYQPDMRTAAKVYADRKFGSDGVYSSADGPWKEAKAIKSGVEPYSDEFVACLGEVAQYIYDAEGRFPVAPATIVVSGVVQAVHIDTDFYDTHFQPGAYLPSHRDHWQ
ncbi:MAG: hypothetical protein WD990_08195, partial [Acidimicrobiia bacterium]